LDKITPRLKFSCLGTFKDPDVWISNTDPRDSPVEGGAGDEEGDGVPVLVRVVDPGIHLGSTAQGTHLLRVELVMRKATVSLSWCVW